MDTECMEADTMLNMDSNTTVNLTEASKVVNLVAYVVESKIELPVFFVGMLANIITFIVLFNMKMNSVCKILLSALAVTDFFASFFGFMNKLFEVIRFHGNIPYGRYSLEIMEVFVIYKLFLMCLGMSSALVIIASAVRTFALRNPLVSRVKMTPSYVTKAISIALTVWVVIFLPCFIYAVWKGCFCDVNHPVCSEFFRIVPNADKARIYFSICAILLGPGTVAANIVCFILLKAAMKASADNVSKVANPHSADESSIVNGSRKNVRMNRMIMFVLIFNTVCIVPSCIQVVSLIINPRKLLFDEANLKVLILDIIAEVSLGFLPNYHFATYLIHNKDFRLKFLQIFFRRKLSYQTPNQTPNYTPGTTPRHSEPNITPLIPQKLNRYAINNSIRNDNL